MLEGDLILELQDLLKKQDELYEEWEKREANLAEAERAYQVLMRQRALLEKASGTPITFTSSFIKGDEDIATLRKQRDICEALAEITKNKVIDLRKRIEATLTLIKNEFARRDDSVPVPPQWIE